MELTRQYVFTSVSMNCMPHVYFLQLIKLYKKELSVKKTQPFEGLRGQTKTGWDPLKESHFKQMKTVSALKNLH